MVLAIALGSDGMFATSLHVVEVITIAVLAVGASGSRVRERLRHAERRSKLIADAGAALQRSLDPEAALGELARAGRARRWPTGAWCT